MKDKEDECEGLRANVEELRSHLENETLTRVDYQNNLQSVNEELSFRKKVHEEVGNLWMGIIWNGVDMGLANQFILGKLVG